MEDTELTDEEKLKLSEVGLKIAAKGLLDACYQLRDALARERAFIEWQLERMWHLLLPDSWGKWVWERFYLKEDERALPKAKGKSG